MNTSWGVKTKLYAMIGAIVTVIAVGGYFVTADLLKVRSSFETYEKSQSYYSHIRHAEMIATNLNLIAMDMLVDSSEDEFKGLDKKRFDELSDVKIDMDALLTSLQKDADDFSMTENVSGLKDSMLLMHRNTESLGNALRTKRLSTEESSKFDRAIDSSKSDSIKKIDKIEEKIRAEFKSASEKQAQAVSNLQKTMLGLVLIVLGTLIFVGISTIRSLVGSMAKVHTTMTKSTKELRQTSDRLADSSQKMATSTAESAAAIQESVSSMAEMTAMLKQTSQHTESASDLAQKILSKSDEGSRVMSDLSDSMTKIALANARLSDITKIIEDIRGRTNLINEIVFKTQLLSVNASIEAARAGHQGKGFSVVANEVANLATMSGKAANEIGTLLHESTSKVSTIVDGTSTAVKGGEHICKNAVQMFASISESIAEISDKVAQIDIATKEQETGIRQTSAALSQMNSATTSTSHVARDNAHLGSLLLKQCDRMVSATSLLNTTLYGDSPAEATIEVREPIAEARPSAYDDHQIDPEMDKVISLNQSELATVLIDKIKVGGSGSYKGTGTDG